MIITPPKYRRVPYKLQGLSWWQQLIVVMRTPPQLELLEDWIITLANGLQIIVPRGFITDGASIPAWLWWLISPFGPLLEGAILHDFGYQHGYLLAVYSLFCPYNIMSLRMRGQYPDIFTTTIPVFVGEGQDFFDNLLRRVVIEASGATVQAGAAYYALRKFGHVAWNRYRERGPAAYNTNSLFLPGVP